MEFLRLLLLSVCLFTTVVYGDNIVHTDSGPVRGKTVRSGNVDAYLGIPFAEPPVGRLRFAKPVPKASWSDVYDATQLPIACVQLNLPIPTLTPHVQNMSEDCLYLNVWVPSTKTDGDKLKAVMFYIHGGAFTTGSSNMRVYDGSKLAEIGDVVVVTINYRLGALGFFVGHTEDAPGNQGLHDQVLALQWIKANARHFNGDPDNIVIFGESAGAFSVSLLQISPSSKNLFKRAILESGSAINPLYTVGSRAAAGIDMIFAEEAGCARKDTSGSQNSDDVLRCLRKLSAKAIGEAQLAAMNRGVYVMLPHFGDELFDQGAVSMFRESQFKDSEVLMGVTRDEGTFFVYFLNHHLKEQMAKDGRGIFNRTTAYEAIKSNPGLQALWELMTPEESERIVQLYLHDVTPESGYVKAVSDAIGDSLITCGNVFQAEYQSGREGPVFFYLFDYQAKSPLPKWIGVPHFAEVPYVFGNPLFGPFTDEEEKLSKGLMDMWTSFAKTGNPNTPGRLQWPSFTAEDPKYYVISDKSKVATRPDKGRCDRWRKVFLTSDQ